MRIDNIKLGAGGLSTGLVIGAGATLLLSIVYPIVGGLLKLVNKRAYQNRYSCPRRWSNKGRISDYNLSS
jgi:hypothetical protein